MNNDNNYLIIIYLFPNFVYNFVFTTGERLFLVMMVCSEQELIIKNWLVRRVVS